MYQLARLGTKTPNLAYMAAVMYTYVQKPINELKHATIEAIQTCFH